MSDERPFQTVVRPAEVEYSPVAVDAQPEEAWSADEIERAYQQALELAEQVAASVEEMPVEAAPAEGLASEPERVVSGSTDSEAEVVASDSQEPPLSAAQILEALLFVGGRPLTVRQLADVLGGSLDTTQVEELLAGLNQTYSAQGRPYEIRLVSGGYRLELRPEFEKVRGRVFGQGPREVKLSQEALEVLAFVAYRQPVSKESLAETGKTGLPGLLRQLLRRELIAVERTEADADVQYRTTARFLELFGLRTLADLPRAESIARR
jgi:segregation and condensation protein B